MYGYARVGSVASVSAKLLRASSVELARLGFITGTSLYLLTGASSKLKKSKHTRHDTALSKLNSMLDTRKIERFVQAGKQSALSRCRMERRITRLLYVSSQPGTIFVLH